MILTIAASAAAAWRSGRSTAAAWVAEEGCWRRKAGAGRAAWCGGSRSKGRPGPGARGAAGTAASTAATGAAGSSSATWRRRRREITAQRVRCTRAALAWQTERLTPSPRACLRLHFATHLPTTLQFLYLLHSAYLQCQRWPLIMLSLRKQPN